MPREPKKGGISPNAAYFLFTCFFKSNSIPRYEKISTIRKRFYKLYHKENEDLRPAYFTLKYYVIPY